jgi:predicted RNase H-like HicB family nuclease
MKTKTKILSEAQIDKAVVAQANNDAAWGIPVRVNKAKKQKTLKILNYRILLRKEPEGGYTVIVPSLPGCVTYGKNIEQAIKMTKEAIALYLESLIAHGEEIPTEEGTLEYTLSMEAYA